jgi:hypothetical protein
MSSTASAHDVRPKASLPLRGAASASEGFIARAMREPLVHFFVAGFALFVVYALLHPERFAADTSRRIELSVTDVGRVELAFILKVRNTATGQRFEILYGRDGRRVITSRDGKGKRWATAWR